MTFEIADPVILQKVESLSQSTGLSRTGVVARAIDRYASELGNVADQHAQLAALLAQIDGIPDRPDATNPLVWDAKGLPA